jgi:hypothetical protein
MPNWTYNVVRFEGSKTKIKELKKKFKSKDNVFDFNKIIPMPKNSKDFQAEGGINNDDMEIAKNELVAKKGKPNNWYLWSAENWGTKWNSVDAEINSESDNHVEYYFRTAWDAPRPIAKTICENGMLEKVSGVTWSCSHEFQEDEESEKIIWTEKTKSEKNNS